MSQFPPPDPDNVFLNVPFDNLYRPKLHALICALACMGRSARCALEVTETGIGRMERIVDLLSHCQFSIHDLSRMSGAKNQPRMNLPFEMGIAYALKNIVSKNKTYQFYILDGKRHRIKQTLSDLSGFDVKIHNNDTAKLIKIVVEWFHSTPSSYSLPTPKDVTEIFQIFRKSVLPALKKEWNGEPPFHIIVANAITLATEENVFPVKSGGK